MTNYKTIDILKENDDKKVSLVKDDNNLYIKKEIALDNIEIYETLASLNIPSIPKIYEISKEEDKLMIIEEYIEIPVLDKYLKSHHLYYEDIYRITSSLLDTLAILHRYNIVHRDIKPENIFYDGNKVILFDFDIARFYNDIDSSDTRLLGSPPYAAPEQYGFKASSNKTDIFALGKLISVLMNLENYQKSKYDKRLKEISKKATEIDPDKRYSDVLKMKEALNIKKSYAIPGFRNDKLYPKIASTIGYLSIVYMCALMEFKSYPNDPIAQFILKIVAFILLIFIIFYCANYLDMRHNMHIFSNRKLYLLDQGLFLIISFFILILSATALINFVHLFI